MLKKTVYFHIDELARDAVTAAGLKKVLAKYGIKLVYGNRLYTSNLLKYCYKAFDAIILPKTSFIKLLANVSSELPPIITLQSEAVGAAACDVKLSLVNILGKEFMEGDASDAEKVYAFCLWGEIHKSQVEEFYPEYGEKCHVVGHPRHDTRCLAVNAEKNDTSSAKINIGLITRAVILNPFDNRHLFNTCYSLINEDDKYYFNNKQTGEFLSRFDENTHVEDYIYTQSIDVRIMFELIKSINYEQHNVFLRVHPREDRTAYETIFRKFNLPVTITNWMEPYTHWAQKMDYVVGPSSTSFYDVLVCGKTPVCTDLIVPERKKHIVSGRADKDELLKYIDHPCTVEELLKQMSKKPEKNLITEGAKSILRRESNYPDSSFSQDKIAEVCKEAVEKSTTGKIERIFATFKFIIFKTLFNFKTYIKQKVIDRKKEQGSTFILLGKTIRYINSLV